MIYKFRSESQVFVNATIDNCKRTIKFGILAEGGSYYNTSNEEIAKRIRASKMYRIGRITECEPELEKEPEKEPVINTPSFEPVGIKTKLVGKRTYAAPVETEQMGVVPALGGDEAENAAIDINDVSSYMEAKTWLKVVKHVDPQQISTKQKTQEYCIENGIVFPNFHW